MANNYHQLSLKDTFSDCKDMFMDDVPSFFQLLEQHFDISLFIPQTFYNAFYQHLGRKREYPLTGFLSALILQKIFPIPTDSLLILLLNLCKELRDFCGFSKVPDAPLFTRFRLGFSDNKQKQRNNQCRKRTAKERQHLAQRRVLAMRPHGRFSALCRS